MSRLIAVLMSLLLMTTLFGAVAAAQDASPPASADCVAPEIPPGTPTVVEEATPMADMASPAAEEEEAAPEPVASPEIPVGEAAPDEVVAEVEATLENIVSCFNAGMYVEFAALHTPDGLMEECGTTNVYDGPMCFGGPFQISIDRVTDVQVHDDGRVSADVTVVFGNFLSRERIFFVQSGDFWLFDESPELPVEAPEGATVVTGELADYEFVLDTTSAPAGDIAFEVTNTGQYPHEIVIVQLPEGITIEDVFADESLFEEIQFFGFAFAMPGDTASLVMVDMEPGTYTLVCFVDEPEGVPHVARGMIAEFEITPAG
jgi:hypothetical protein